MSESAKLLVETAPREVILSRTIAAPRELVFDAFTKAEHLSKWFGPHHFTATAETDPRPGGKYRLTMHGPDGGPPEMKGPFPMIGEYREFVRPERLVYTHDLVEHPDSWKEWLKNSMAENGDANPLFSVVTVTFENVEGNTKLTIRTRFESDAIRDGYVKMQMNEGWGQSLEKLETLVVSQYKGDVVIERHYNAPVERVWDALANNEQMKQWYFVLPEFKPVVGFEFEFPGEHPTQTYLHKCTVVEVIPNKKLAYSWRYDGYQGDSIVSFELSREGAGTKLRLTHTGLSSFAVNNNRDLDAHNFAAGWTSILDESLTTFLEA